MVHEIWQYKITCYDRELKLGGIFSEYINEFFKQKVMYSGFPSDCVTNDDKMTYVQRLSADEGIELKVEKIFDNPGCAFRG